MAAEQLVLGEFVRKFDERYRLSIPQELMDGLLGDQTQAVLVKEQTGALSLWEGSQWLDKYRRDMDLLSSKLAAGRLQSRQSRLQTLGRLLSTRHREVAISGRSRLLIPEGFREFLGVEPGGDVLIVGAAVCIELWRPEMWQQHLQNTMPQYEVLMDELAG